MQVRNAVRLTPPPVVEVDADAEVVELLELLEPHAANAQPVASTANASPARLGAMPISFNAWILSGVRPSSAGA
jgi:hypothetical protein